jgi:hypothetical protein
MAYVHTAIKPGALGMIVVALISEIHTASFSERMKLTHMWTCIRIDTLILTYTHYLRPAVALRKTG